MVGADTLTSWVCPQCSRRVPMRIEACRCGAPRPEAPPPPPAYHPPVTPAGAGHAPATWPGASFDESLRSPKETTLFWIGAVFSGLVWLLVVVSLVGILYGAAGLIFGLVVHALFLAHVRGNALRVSESQLPELHAAALRAARALGLAEPPEVYVMQADGSLNAFATKLLGRKFVILFSDLVDACEDPRQLDFVIAHEVGHLAAGHLMWRPFLWPFMLVPLLGAAYSRACEYTCDRCGVRVAGDDEASMRGLIVLAAGGRQAARADIRSFMEQRLETGQFWSAVVELGSTHPFLCKRVAALHELSHPGTIEIVRRNPLAYPLAPFLAFGSMAGGGLTPLLLMVAVIGIIAAIAIPSLLRARIVANESTAIGAVRSVVSAEASFAQVAGRFGTTECLVAPSRCVRGYQGPAFLGPEFASEVQSGYRRALAVAQDGRAFVFRAEPLTRGQTGNRSFCADATGQICASQEPIPDVGFDCPSRCAPLR
jgi:Zn-dependent protease with chaperone function/type II secretory pathway pseudopilin PulG